MFLGHAETVSGLLGWSQSSAQLFYTALLKQQHQIDDFQKVLDKIPWLLASPITEALEQNLEGVPRLDARVAAILPFEVDDIPKTGFENTDIHELSRFFKIERHGQQQSLEQIINNQRAGVGMASVAQAPAMPAQRRRAGKLLGMHKRPKPGRAAVCVSPPPCGVIVSRKAGYASKGLAVRNSCSECTNDPGAEPLVTSSPPPCGVIVNSPRNGAVDNVHVHAGKRYRKTYSLPAL